jgi:phosphatidate cytidylyltransferase
VSLGSLWELSRLIERKGFSPVMPVALAAVVCYVGLTYAGKIREWESGLLGATLVLALAFATFGRKGDAIARSGFTLLSVLYVGKLTSYFIAIRDLPAIGFSLTLFVTALIVGTDTFAMIVGKSIGKTPLSPLSPRKTVEGAIGGFVAACAIGGGAAAIPGGFGPISFTWWQGVSIAAFTRASAQSGDLVESALKRDANVKDAGTALGGHGGVLDRFDSFLFGGIAFYFALWAAGFAVPGLHEMMHSR